MKSVADLHSDDFQACLGEAVTVPFGGRSVELTVDEVQVTGPGFDRPEAFSVLFTGPDDAPLPQQMHALGHGRLGGAEVFLVPIGRDDRGYHYEAVFN